MDEKQGQQQSRHGTHGHGPMHHRASEPIGRWLVLMSLMGVAALWAMAALVELRIGRAVPAPASISKRTLMEPIEALRAGLDNRLAHASASLGDDQSARAAVALDAAMRLARVADESIGTPYGEVLARVRDARSAIQKGRPERARHAVEAARIAIEAGDPDGPRGEDANAVPTDEGRYRGATVINAQGVRIGEVDRVSGDTIWLLLGGATDVLGFVDWPEDAVALEVSTVVLGEPKEWGSTLVMLPLFATDPAAIVAAMDRQPLPGR